MEYLVKKNIVTIKNSEEKLLNFEFLLNDTIRIYTKKNKTDLIELNLFKTRKKFEIKEDNGNIVINYLNYTFKINDKLGFDLYINSKFITAYSFNVYFDDYEKKNYFNSIPWREARLQLGHCRFMEKEEFSDGTFSMDLIL